MGGKSPFGILELVSRYFPPKDPYAANRGSNLPLKKAQQPAPKKEVPEFTISKLVMGIRGSVRGYVAIEGQEIGLKVKKDTVLYVGLPRIVHENIRGTEFKIPKNIDELVHSESYETQYGDERPPEIFSNVELRYGELYKRDGEWYFFEPNKTQPKPNPLAALGRLKLGKRRK